ncbi:oxidoreductase [Limimaricola litoreus]|uniref:Oxidoreductase n=1 Tax=Limimaricola litoreus TaxID=2955316 RepID=A0A9X2JS73_9RHOB|nr:oxidoreductase [Limimaricola litoreus]MCP1169426.1 oxidoreductase [Limimaricola litoreus]
MKATLRCAMAALMFSQAMPARAEMTPGMLSVGREGEALVVLDLDDLDALPQTDFETATIWTDEIQFFSGVPVAALLDHAGLPDAIGREGGVLRLVALNDYKVEIPLDEITPEQPIIATRIDGETVSVRDKGPYWLVYPYDLDARYRREEIYHRSIWQLAQMIVVE